MAEPYQYYTSLDYKSISDRGKIKITVYEQYRDEIEKWENIGIYLSKIELEEDLHAALSTEHLDDLPSGNFIAYLQDAKKKNMNHFVNNYLTREIAETIFYDDRFTCLKKLVGVDKYDS